MAMKRTYVTAPEDCPEIERHTSCPRGYVEWHEWAERMGKTHQVTRCPACNLWAIWVKK